MGKRANTMDLKTIMFLILGLIVPFWPISLPLFRFLAWRAYKSGAPPAPSLSEMAEAQRLLDSGVISQAEFNNIRSQVLSGRR